MNILWIYTREFPQSPVKPIVDFDAIHFGISAISSFLKKHHHATRLLVLTRETPFSDIDQFIEEVAPKVICFTAVSSEYLFVEKVARYIRSRYPDIFLLCGGVHVSLAAQEQMLEVFDALCIGEGEDATLEVVEQIEQGHFPTGISNLWIKTAQGDIEKNPPRPLIEDLDAFPLPDREMWTEWIDLDRSPMRPTLLLGRGCPFVCTYCCNHALRKLAAGNYVRFRSPASIIQELHTILTQFPMVKEVYLEIETFLARKEWSLELCAQLQRFNATRSEPLRFGVNIRITPHIDQSIAELFSAMQQSNFRFINIGLESGSERLRKDVLKRVYSNEDVLRVVTLAKQFKFDVIFYNLLGLPFETIQDFNETVTINRLCLPDRYFVSIFYPYPGTDLYALCEQHHWLRPDLLNAKKERVIATLTYPDFSKEQIQKAYIWFDYYVFRGHRSLEELTQLVVNKYRDVYYQQQHKIPLIMLKDVFSPSLNFASEYQEYKVLFAAFKQYFRQLKYIKYLRKFIKKRFLKKKPLQ